LLHVVCVSVLAVALFLSPAAQGQQYPPPTPTAAPEGAALPDDTAGDDEGADPSVDAEGERETEVLGTSFTRDADADSGGRSLPRTGLNLLVLLAWALALIAAGRRMIRSARRRRTIQRSRATAPRVHRVSTTGFVPRASVPAPPPPRTLTELDVLGV
jgi:hypothetical protein